MRFLDNIPQPKLTFQQHSISNKYTALHWAIHFQNIAILEILFKRGAHFKIYDNANRTLLEFAAINEKWLALEWMLQISPNAIPGDPLHYDTVLLCAVIHQQTNIVKSILEKNTQFTATTKNNSFSTLHWAVARKNKQLVQLLLDYGAPLQDKNNAQQTAYQMSVDLNLPELVNCFRQNIASKYRYLCNLRDSINNLCNTRGFNFFTIPNGIKRLKSAIGPLPLSINMENNIYIIEQVFLDCYAILKEKQISYEGFGTRLPDDQQFYKTQFELITQARKCTHLMDEQPGVNFQQLPSLSQ